LFWNPHALSSVVLIACSIGPHNFLLIGVIPRRIVPRRNAAKYSFPMRPQHVLAFLLHLHLQFVLSLLARCTLYVLELACAEFAYALHFCQLCDTHACGFCNTSGQRIRRPALRAPISPVLMRSASAWIAHLVFLSRLSASFSFQSKRSPEVRA